jgi:hypothetical protein
VGRVPWTFIADIRVYSSSTPERCENKGTRVIAAKIELTATGTTATTPAVTLQPVLFFISCPVSFQRDRTRYEKHRPESDRWRGRSRSRSCELDFCCCYTGTPSFHTSLACCCCIHVPGPAVTRRSEELSLTRFTQRQLAGPGTCTQQQHAREGVPEYSAAKAATRSTLGMCDTRKEAVLG